MKTPLEKAYQQAATAGPLRIYYREFGCPIVENKDCCGVADADLSMVRDRTAREQDELAVRTNVTLLAHAFNVLPDVLAMLDRLTDVVANLDENAVNFNPSALVKDARDVINNASFVEVQ